MTIRNFADAKGKTEMSADVVIVGSGPGGAAASRVLAEAGFKVVIVEEGPGKTRFRQNMAHTMRYHMQEGGSMIALGTAPVSVAAGRGVGGGSLINSAICWRTPHHVLESWIPLLGGDDRFSPSHMEPVFDEVGEIIEVTLTTDFMAGENNRIVARGAKALGLPGGYLNRNAPTCIGCGVCNFGCPSGGKASVDRNLIALARGAGAIVQADVKIDTILVDGDRAVGVSGKVADTDTREVVGEFTVHAPVVMVCAGAIGTPRLLLRAGLGPRLGPAVGVGLHLHPGNGVFGLCDHEVHMWHGATQGAYFEDPELPGVLPHTLSLPPSALLLAFGQFGLDAKKSMELVPYVCGCLVMVSDKGSGTVGITAEGNADLRYWFDPHDVEMMRKGLKRTVDVLLAGGAKKLLVPVAGTEWVDHAQAAYDQIDAAKLTDYQLLYAAHPMATCRMGTDPNTSVIGPDGQAHGLSGLYIADSSIFPTSLGVNPQFTTMVMATIIARHLAAELKGAQPEPA